MIALFDCLVISPPVTCVCYCCDVGEKKAFADLLLFMNLFCQYERQSEKDDVQKKTEEVDAELKAEFEELHHLLTSKVGYGEEE